LAEVLESPLFGQENKTITQTQDGEGRTRPQPEVFPKFLRDGELTLLANFGRRQIL